MILIYEMLYGFTHIWQSVSEFTKVNHLHILVVMYSILSLPGKYRLSLPVNKFVTQNLDDSAACLLFYGQVFMYVQSSTDISHKIDPTLILFSDKVW